MVSEREFQRLTLMYILQTRLDRGCVNKYEAILGNLALASYVPGVTVGSVSMSLLSIWAGHLSRRLQSIINDEERIAGSEEAWRFVWQTMSISDRLKIENAANKLDFTGEL